MMYHILPLKLFKHNAKAWNLTQMISEAHTDTHTQIHILRYKHTHTEHKNTHQDTHIHRN